MLNRAERGAIELAQIGGDGITAFPTDLRRGKMKCRRCLANLAKDPINEWQAFCSRGCHRYFFKNRCVICDGSKSGIGLCCTRPTCLSSYRSNRRKYAWQGKDTANVVPRSETSIFIGSDEVPRQFGDRKFRLAAGPPVHWANLVPDGHDAMTWAGGSFERHERESRKERLARFQKGPTDNRPPRTNVSQSKTVNWAD